MCGLVILPADLGLFCRYHKGAIPDVVTEFLLGLVASPGSCFLRKRFIRSSLGMLGLCFVSAIQPTPLEFLGATLWLRLLSLFRLLAVPGYHPPSTSSSGSMAGFRMLTTLPNSCCCAVRGKSRLHKREFVVFGHPLERADWLQNFCAPN
jgi:hypothetical protein